MSTLDDIATRLNWCIGNAELAETWRARCLERRYMLLACAIRAGSSGHRKRGAELHRAARRCALVAQWWWSWAASARRAARAFEQELIARGNEVDSE